MTICTGGLTFLFLFRRACRWTHPGPWVYSAIPNLPARPSYSLYHGTLSHILNTRRLCRTVPVIHGVETASSLPLQCWSRAIQLSAQQAGVDALLTVDPITGLFSSESGRHVRNFSGARATSDPPWSPSRVTSHPRRHHIDPIICQLSADIRQINKIVDTNPWPFVPVTVHVSFGC